MFTSTHGRGKLVILILLGLAALPVRAEQTDLTDLSLEQLLTVEVTSASKYTQRTVDAPSAVQIISREDIRLHGWRTLTEALLTLPGMYANNDRVYDFLGARGFQIPGDYNTRFLLLIDGQRNNDNIYQSAITGSEGWLDMSVVERIEYIPGPGSAIYGSNAMFGVINVITRGAEKTAQSQVGATVSQLGLSEINVMTSQYVDDTGLILQYSNENQAGRDQTYSDPAGNLFRANNTLATDGVAHGLDSGNNRHLMVRTDHNEWSFKLINHERTVTPSSAPYLTVFDDPSLRVNDGGTQFTASLQHEISGASSVFARLGYTDWHYRATYPYLDGGAGYYHNYDDTRGQVLDGEFRYQLHSGDHHLLTGLEFSRDLLARQINFNSLPAATLGTADVNINPLINRSGLFVQDEWRFADNWLLSLGLRRDTATASESSHSPRLGVIWQPNSVWTAKLLTGKAYRSANAYESQFGNGLNYLSNPGLQPETIRTIEGVLEWLSTEQMRWQFSLYNNKLNNLIQQVDTTGTGVLQFQNRGWVRVYGAELGVEKITASNLKLRASISGSHAQNDQGGTQENSPNWTAKTSASAPVFDHSAYLAAEVQAIAGRRYSWGAASYRVGSEVLANATLTFPNVWAQGLRAQVRITNLFNRDVQHPASPEMPTPTVPQNGRNLTAQLDYVF